MEQAESQNGGTDRIGVVVDKRYRITGLLGRGGMGSVYRAEHVTIKRPVALKLLHGALGQMDQIQARFEREAFAAGRVDHPNCVTASDFGELDDGSRYLVMELLDGVSLGEVLERDGALPVEQALHITRHLLHGLRYAHKAGVVHRDIKPDNVILEAKDNDPHFARLLDFGIAKLLGDAEAEEGGAKLTQAGIAFGTPVYMSPEQAYGDPVDPRADLYALSVMLYEMLAGAPPFWSDDKLAVLHMHRDKPPPPFAEVVPDRHIPAGVERLVRKGLEKRRDDRFQSADEFLTALVALMPQWETDAIWAERTPTALRKVAHTPRPVLQPHRGPTTPNPVPPPPSVDQAAAAAMLITPPPHQAVVPRRRRLSRLEIGLVIAVSALTLMFILLVAGSSDDPADRYEAAVQQLESGETCEQRKQAVASLLELGDKRAIEPLRRARDRKARRRSPKSNRCLRKAAIEAIVSLQKRP